MNVNPDLPTTLEVEDAATDSQPAKPVRRKRAAPVKADEAAATVALDDAAPVAAEPAEAAPKPARRRRSVAPQGESVVEVHVEATTPALAPPLFSLAVEPERIETAPAEFAPVVESVEPSPERVVAEGSESNPQEGASEGPRSERARRRGRRDRRDRGEPRELEAGRATEDGDEGDDAAAPVPTPPADAGQLFTQVLSGEFDTSFEAPAESDEPSVAADEPLAQRRVLPAEPDAPKLQKVLAQAGVGSRRDMEELILEGLITVNDQPAHIGQRISFGDQVKVRGKPVRFRINPPPPRIIAYHKPVGEVVTHDDPQHRPTVFRRLPRLQQGKWQSVGRLDINTEGLLLFTNSGELANQLMHPRFGVEREYAVRVLGTLLPEDRANLLEGVLIEGQKCSFRSIEDGGGEGANRWYRVVITEGRNREVRKLFDSVELTVSRLIRIRYGTVVLPLGLKRGVWVDLEEGDVRAIRRLASNDGGQRDARAGGRGNNERAAGPNPPRNQRNERNDRARPNERERGNEQRGNERGNERGNSGPRGLPQGEAVTQQAALEPRGLDRDIDPDHELDIDPSQIPNPLEQTFDKRFVQNPRSPAGGRGFNRGGGGFGAGGSAPNPANPKKGGGPREPDPLQTSIGYLGADAFHRKGNKGGGRGGNRGGGGSGGGFGGAGGNRGGGFSGGGGAGGGGAGGGRRGR